jgi:hypothetical protein
MTLIDFEVVGEGWNERVLDKGYLRGEDEGGNSQRQQGLKELHRGLNYDKEKVPVIVNGLEEALIMMLDS